MLRTSLRMKLSVGLTVVALAAIWGAAFAAGRYSNGSERAAPALAAPGDATPPVAPRFWWEAEGS